MLLNSCCYCMLLLYAVAVQQWPTSRHTFYFNHQTEFELNGTTLGPPPKPPAQRQGTAQAVYIPPRPRPMRTALTYPILLGQDRRRRKRLHRTQETC